MGSQEVVFVTDQALPDGARVELGIAWPFLLEGRARLQLVMDAKVTRTEGKLAEARIQKYHFKTRGEWSEAGEAGQSIAVFGSQAAARPTLVAFRTQA